MDEPITEATEAVTEIIEVIESSPYLQQIADATSLSASLLVAFMVIILCYFAYKFLRIFF